MVYKILPGGWPVKLNSGFAGHFIYNGQLCFKSKYGKPCDAGKAPLPEAFNSGGEYFHSVADVLVQPITVGTEEDDD